MHENEKGRSLKNRFHDVPKMSLIPISMYAVSQVRRRVLQRLFFANDDRLRGDRGRVHGAHGFRLCRVRLARPAPGRAMAHSNNDATLARRVTTFHEKTMHCSDNEWPGPDISWPRRLKVRDT